MRRLPALLSIAAVALGGVVGGCGGSGSGASGPLGPAATTKPAGGADNSANSESGAAALRSSLAALLTDHVYRTGIALTTGVRAGFDSPRTAAAQKAVADNDVALGRLARALTTAGGARKLGVALQREDAVLGAYAKARAAGSDADAARARSSLVPVRAQLARALAKTGSAATPRSIGTDLAPALGAVAAAIDAAKTDTPAVYRHLADAASRMQTMAELLADNAVRGHGDEFGGAASSGAAALRAGLTGLLSEHTYLTSLALGAQGADATAARAAVDANSLQLSEAMSSVFGEDQAAAFLKQWRGMLTLLDGYADAQRAHDSAASRRKLDQLTAARDAFDVFMAQSSPRLDRAAFTTQFGAHLDAMAAIVRAEVSHSPKAYTRIANAAAAVPGVARLLARGVSLQFPSRFPATTS